MRSIPWITDESFFYLKNFIEKTKKVHVLEFGSGASTIWFDLNQDVDKLISVEDNTDWYNIVNNKINKLKTTVYNLMQPYNDICESLNEQFDIIVIDGRNRNRCFLSCLKLLKTNGIIVFDNTERHFYSPCFDFWNQENMGEILRFKQNGPDITGWLAPHEWETTIFIKK